MKKFKKKFLLTGLVLAVPLVGAIASACSEVSQGEDRTPPSGGSGNSTMMKSNNDNILENLPSSFN